MGADTGELRLPGRRVVHHPVLAPEVGSRLFASLQRSGQRLRAEQYVRGLVGASGRKTLRNIAAQVGGASAQQSMHHFISESPWEWGPVRRALAGEARLHLGHEAWVISPTAIPKAGAHSIGVDLQYMPHLGQTLNGQQAVGAWLVSEAGAVPVDWQLVLPRRWRADPMRRRANIPAHVRAESLEECVRETAAAACGGAGLARGPVIVDAEGADAVAIARKLGDDGHEFIIRTPPGARLRIDRSVLPAYGARERTAEELVTSLTALRSRVGLKEGRTAVTAIPVVAPDAPPGPARAGRGPHGEGLRLVGELVGERPGVERPVGERPVGERGGGRLWLTNMSGISVPALLRLTRLTNIVARDFEGISERVGIRDFAGRSYSGWHRHITLASVAHFATVLAGTDPAVAAKVTA